MTCPRLHRQTQDLNPDPLIPNSHTALGKKQIASAPERPRTWRKNSKAWNFSPSAQKPASLSCRKDRMGTSGGKIESYEDLSSGLVGQGTVEGVRRAVSWGGVIKGIARPFFKWIKSTTQPASFNWSFSGSRLKGTSPFVRWGRRGHSQKVD